MIFDHPYNADYSASNSLRERVGGADMGSLSPPDRDFADAGAVAAESYELAARACSIGRGHS